MSWTSSIVTFEMDGADIGDEVPCVVIKGICDYADSYKSKVLVDIRGNHRHGVYCNKTMLVQYTFTDKHYCNYYT